MLWYEMIISDFIIMANLYHRSSQDLDITLLEVKLPCLSVRRVGRSVVRLVGHNFQTAGRFTSILLSEQLFYIRICNSVMITERKFTRKEYYLAFTNERTFGVSQPQVFASFRLDLGGKTKQNAIHVNLILTYICK